MTALRETVSPDLSKDLDPLSAAPVISRPRLRVGATEARP